MSAQDPIAGEDAEPPLLDPDGNPLRFEAALSELESLVDRMERGELSLEESVACFERGMRLHRHCQRALESANQKVQVLMRRSEVARAGDLGDLDEADELDDER